MTETTTASSEPKDASASDASPETNRSQPTEATQPAVAEAPAEAPTGVASLEPASDAGPGHDLTPDEPVDESAQALPSRAAAEDEPISSEAAAEDEPISSQDDGSTVLEDQGPESSDGDAIAIPIAAGPPPEPQRATFADLGLSEDVLRAISDMGYSHPTPIQEQAVPYVLMGRDVLGIAQTGTGKTAGFTLPMLDILTGRRARARMPRSLILEPTRELALQVAENFVQYGKYLKLTHALIIGGESMTDQRDILNRGVDVLIATPGRLLDMFERGSVLLSDTGLLVIDEADRMLDMGFIPDVERIVSLLPANRQTLFFSATMGPEIKRLADAFLRNPKEVTVSRAASVATTITEGLALVADHDKREALRRLVRSQNVQNALIFCNRKIDVDILYKSLTKHQFSAGALHGDLSQTIRFQTLEKFKAGDLKLLVCSDVAARGLDIGGLSHVFNFDVPIHAEDYVHRIGRTGRAGLTGHAFTIAAPDDRYHVEQIEKLIGHAIPPVIVEGLDPVDWAEGNGKKRRRSSGKPEPRRSAPRSKAAATEPKERKPRSRRNEAPVEEPKRAARPRREDTRREEPSREESRWEAPPPRREERTRDEGRRERYRRDDDLGPTVVGFGDEVPAFMLLRPRRPQSNDISETDA
ncbi:MAG: DEAD/DEAH box helicase [Acetobacteraceae bacterium]